MKTTSSSLHTLCIKMDFQEMDFISLILRYKDMLFLEVLDTHPEMLSAKKVNIIN